MLLNRTVVVPESVTLLMPMTSTTPVAVIANVPLANRTTPTVALRSSRPVAVGLRSPFSSFSGP